MAKLPLRERRRQRLLNALARLRKEKDAGIKAIVKAERMMPVIERRLRNYDKAPKPRPAAAVVSKPPLPTIEPEMAAEGIPDFLRRAPTEAEARDKKMAAAGFRKVTRSRKKKIDAAPTA